VHSILFENKPPMKALGELMGRPQRTEVWR
jgi:hypothetical protein